MKFELTMREVVEAYQSGSPLCDEPVAVRKPRSSRQRARCTCGECFTCKENARWERIFNEKFADPDYYCRTRPVCGSSLNAWR